VAECIYAIHPSNRALQKTFCAKSWGRSKDTFGKRFQVYRFKGSDRILCEGDRQFYLMRWELIALHVIIRHGDLALGNAVVQSIPLVT